MDNLVTNGETQSRLQVKFEEKDTFSSLESRIKNSIERTKDHLLSLQHPQGYWVAELKADTTLPSDYILMMQFLGIQAPDKVRKLTNYIRSQQLKDGSWNIYPGGSGEISATVKAYTAFKLAGFSKDEPFMRLACEAIVRLGGVERCNSFTKIYLALIGQYEKDATPDIPPEIILMPSWFYFNVYEMSSWSRAIVIPLSLMHHHWPEKPVPAGRGIDELFEGQSRPKKIHFDKVKIFSWKNFFLVIDSLLKIYEKSPVKPFRKLALRRAASWMLERLELSDGLGAIYPAMVNSIFALHCLGYANDHPLIVRALKQLEDFEVEEKDTLRIQPCFSPVWDTGLSLVSLCEAGIESDHPGLQKAAHWLLEKEVRKIGDWKIKAHHAEVGGWYFEFQNEFYPDVDDTIMVLMALKKLHPLSAFWPRDLIVGMEAAMNRGLSWVQSMQNRDGGWSSFDHNNSRTIFTKVPFADHNAMLDPSTADITGRVLEMLAVLGFDQKHSQVPKAVQYLKREQEPDGSWYGRWGVNYIYGTWQVLKGLRMIGEDIHQPYCQKAIQWLKSCQNADGGWGESIRSYDDPTMKAKGESTPSQTAWALMGLLTGGDLACESIRRGLDYLTKTQKPDGSWDEEPYTGTGFPRVFYIKYEYYRIYFPLFALASYLKLNPQSKSMGPVN